MVIVRLQQSLQIAPLTASASRTSSMMLEGLISGPIVLTTMHQSSSPAAAQPQGSLSLIEWFTPVMDVLQGKSILHLPSLGQQIIAQSKPLSSLLLQASLVVNFIMQLYHMTRNQLMLGVTCTQSAMNSISSQTLRQLLIKALSSPRILGSSSRMNHPFPPGFMLSVMCLLMQLLIPLKNGILAAHHTPVSPASPFDFWFVSLDSSDALFLLHVGLTTW